MRACVRMCESVRECVCNCECECECANVNLECDIHHSNTHPHMSKHTGTHAHKTYKHRDRKNHAQERETYAYMHTYTYIYIAQERCAETYRLAASSNFLSLSLILAKASLKAIFKSSSLTLDRSWCAFFICWLAEPGASASSQNSAASTYLCACVRVGMHVCVCMHACMRVCMWSIYACMYEYPCMYEMCMNTHVFRVAWVETRKSRYHVFFRMSTQ